MRFAIGWLFIITGFCLATSGVDHLVTSWHAQESAATAEPHRAGHFVPPPGFVAHLSIPRLDTSLYVVRAKSRLDLRRGPGMIAGSTPPGGANCIIAGHRDLHFRILKDLRVGDDIELDSPQGRFVYRVASFQIASATEDAALRPVYKDQLTLVTCYPFFYLGPAPRRFIVKARRR
jgi:sortase A